MRLIAFALVLILVGCFNASPEKSLAVACQGYASTLSSLAVAKARDQLSGGDIAAVDAARPTLNAICLEDDWTDPVAARSAVEAAMWQLIMIEEAVP